MLLVFWSILSQVYFYRYYATLLEKPRESFRDSVVP